MMFEASVYWVKARDSNEWFVAQRLDFKTAGIRWAMIDMDGYMNQEDFDSFFTVGPKIEPPVETT